MQVTFRENCLGRHELRANLTGAASLRSTLFLLDSDFLQLIHHSRFIDILQHQTSTLSTRNPKMRATRALRMYTAQLTLFTRANCGLCDTAKARLDQVQKKRTIDYQEVDILAEGQKKWRDMYEFDVPVLHVQSVFHTYSKPNQVADPKKLMHRFTVEEVEKLVDEAEQGIPGQT